MASNIIRRAPRCAVLAAALLAACGLAGVDPGAADAPPPSVSAIAPATGGEFGGTKIVISGTGLGGATGVRFGDKPAAYWRVDTPAQSGASPTVSAVSPPHSPGSVEVVVTTPAGDLAPWPFTYLAGVGWQAAADGGFTWSSATATALSDGRVLVMGASVRALDCGETEFCSTVAVYDPAGAGGAGTWVRPGQFATPRYNVPAVPLPDGTVLVAGGATRDPVDKFNGYVATKTAEVFDPAGARWHAVPSMGTPRLGLTLTALANGDILAAGGATRTDGATWVPRAPDGVDTAELYHPIGNTWRAAAPMDGPRVDHAATLLDPPFCRPASVAPGGYPCGAVLVTGGMGPDQVDLRDAVLYQPAGDDAGPAADGWRPVAPMTTARHDHSATLLDDGRVLVVGTDSAEIFDPTQLDAATGLRGRWQPAAPPVAPLGPVPHTATRLADGRVLVVGSSFGLTDIVSQIFDPGGDHGTGSWSAAGVLARRDPNMSAAVLPDGDVLVAGGVHASRDISSLFEPEPPEVFAASPGRPFVVTVDPPAGPSAGGVPVTIRGRHLFPTTSVQFGSGPADVRFAANEEVQVVPPPRPAGTRVDITVTTPFGTSPPSASRFTYALGDWAPTLDACLPAGACGGRRANTAVPLECPEGEPRPAGYPCGKVFVAGATERAVTLHVVQGSKTAVGVGISFGADDTGKRIQFETEAPDALVDQVVSSSTITMSAPWPARTTDDPAFLTGSSAEVFDPTTGGWAQAHPMLEQRSNYSGSTVPAFNLTALENGDVLAVGGAKGDARAGADDLLGTAEIYHPATDTWTTTGSLQPYTRPGETPLNGRLGQTATLLSPPFCHLPTPPPDYPCGKVLVAGGMIPSTQQVLDSSQLFDPTNGTWALTEANDGTPTAMAVPALGATATLLPKDGTVVVTGGMSDLGNGVFSRSSQLFDPRTQTWRSTATPAGVATEMHYARLGHQATLLDAAFCHPPATPPAGYPCGGVLVTGGFNDARPDGSPDDGRSRAELFDPSRGTWDLIAAPLSEARIFHTSTLLPDGRVLVAGGQTDSGAGVPTAEVFDPIRRNSSQAASMGRVRFLHTAALLSTACGDNCGKVLVAGGFAAAGGSDRTLTAELYTPAPTVTAVAPSTGPSSGGSRVTIAGIGWAASGADPPAVEFGGTPASSVRVVSDSEVVATTPPHPSGPVQVTVRTRARGWSAVFPADPAASFDYTVSQAPGRVGDLAAEAVSESQVLVRFSAVSGDGPFPPPARRYDLRQSDQPIVDDAGFDAARPLCPGGCVLAPAAAGAALTVSVGGLAPATEYHFALRAANDKGVAGALSNPAQTTTKARPGAPGGGSPAPASGCPAAAGGPSTTTVGAGWSLVGLPAGVAVPADAPLYGWADQGAGGRYRIHDAAHPFAAGEGYWAYLACPATLALPHRPAGSLGLTLGAYHASMVGNPADAAATVSGYDYAARWDPAMNGGAGGYHLSGYRQSLTLAPGEGLWVFSYTDTTVRIAW